MSSSAETSALTSLPGLALAAAAVAAGGAAAILTALGFQYLGGYEPCDLCFKQRWAYALSIPLAALAAVLVARGSIAGAIALLTICAFAYLANAGLGVYHAGVEWKWWPGPTSCSGGGLSIEGGSVIDSIRKQRVVRCDEAPWRFLGLSFAGYSALISAALASIAGLGLWRARGRNT